MRPLTSLRWVLLAIAGILIAVAVAVAASKLTSQRIGLASEPLEAGEALAPPGDRAGGDRGPRPGETSTATTTAATTTPETTTATATTTTGGPPVIPSEDASESDEAEAGDDD